MGKKFMGLDGTDHFWDRAKAWILEQIKPAVIDKQAVIDAVYPIGSLYWSSKDTDPSTLFGGTWVQIKDRFILACGDTYTSSGATGGASTVTLSVDNMPSHTHSYTPSGTVSSSFSGTSSTTYGNGEHSHMIPVTTSEPGSGSSDIYPNYKFTSTPGTENTVANSNFARNSTYYLPYATDSNYISCFSAPVDRRKTNFFTFAVLATLSGYHTHNFTTSGTVSSSFSGSAGTTESEGSGTSFSILPPYVVKYCWERTA